MWMAYVHMRMLLAQREIDSVRKEYACLYICSVQVEEQGSAW